jgi:hypothetical protein
MLYQYPLDPLDPERLDDAERWQEYDTKKKNLYSIEPEQQFVSKLLVEE